MSIESHYGNQNIAITRPAEAADGSGGTTLTFAAHLTIDGLIQPLSAEEMMVYDRIGVKATYLMFCGIHDIDEKDRVTEDSTVYAIVGKPINAANKDHHLETLLERLI